MTQPQPAFAYTSRDLLSGQMESLHTASSNLLLLSLVPAIYVAWADGRIQDEERATILSLAERHGLAGDPAAMARIERWLHIGLSDDEVEASAREL